MIFKPRVAPTSRQKPSASSDLKVLDQKTVDVQNSCSENFPEIPRTDESCTDDPCTDIPCADEISADADMLGADMLSADVLSADVANTDYSETEPPMCPLLDTSLANISSSTFVIDDEEFPLPQDLVNLYTNTNYVTPSPTTLSTIFETPRLVKGDEVFYSKVAKYRYFKFAEGCWYHVPPAKRILRRKKARNNGWTKAKKAIDEQCASLVSDAMNRLDRLMLEDSN
ncbi:hypothetical protein EB796_003324 [Bugula neritina]|uniref:Uncharacterized protein n=1 Tax=Bugula neritina TaxID=10212 RepID=A0A7J7KI65_BUGNE|nr:hypothetical protein EB796_003324 [Bugula neritina]